MKKPTPVRLVVWCSGLTVAALGGEVARLLGEGGVAPAGGEEQPTR